MGGTGQIWAGGKDVESESDPITRVTSLHYRSMRNPTSEAMGRKCGYCGPMMK